MMNPASRIYVAGHTGMVGSAIVRRLERDGYENIGFPKDRVDLRDQRAVGSMFIATRPEYVFLAAAKVGGIGANSTHPAEFIYDNLMIQSNVIHAAWRSGVKKLLFLGSSCIYPRNAPQPIKEEYLMTGALEKTNQAYAVAKIAGLTLAAAYREEYGFDAISLMPTNLYGPGDNFNLESSHVLAALIRRFHEAKLANAPEVVLWGTGGARREFLHVDDLADAAVFAMRNYSGSLAMNVGTGIDMSITLLAGIVAGTVGYQGAVRFDQTHPDGTPAKRLDVSFLAHTGWRPEIDLISGIRSTYQWYLENENEARR